MNIPNRRRTSVTKTTLATAGVVAVLALATACGSTGSSGSTPDTSAPADRTPGAAVLPVTVNPITNTSTDQNLTIDRVLVENNEDASGKAVDDHLEVAVTNTGTTELTGFEVYYTITDPKTTDTESYYTELPTAFTIAGGDSRVIHFDNTSAPDHFAVNQYSLYYTDTNALDIAVEVSAAGSAPQTATIAKDPGGAEEAD